MVSSKPAAAPYDTWGLGEAAPAAPVVSNTTGGSMSAELQEEYDPARPNDYEHYRKLQREETQRAEEEAARRRQEEAMAQMPLPGPPPLPPSQQAEPQGGLPPPPPPPPGGGAAGGGQKCAPPPLPRANQQQHDRGGCRKPWPSAGAPLAFERTLLAYPSRLLQLLGITVLVSFHVLRVHV